MSTTRTRRVNFQPREKVAIVRQHLLEGVPISKLCDEHGIRPTQFYLWQKQLFEHGATAFQNQADSRQKELERDNARLRAQLAGKDEVIAEVTAEFVKLKKARGES